jgi:hypothetical protein
MSWSPRQHLAAPNATVYLVLDSFGAIGTAYRETDIERADLETVIADLMSGEFNEPLSVVAFNTFEHWADDVSRQIAVEIQRRYDIADEPVPEHILRLCRRPHRSNPAVGAAVGVGAQR